MSTLTLRGQTQKKAERGLSLLGRVGLAGRTGFYLILTALTVRIAMLGGRSGRQADAHGALAAVSRPMLGKVAIAAVGVGFLMFGVGRLVGAVVDDTVSTTRRVLTALQGLFYVALTYVPVSYLAGNHQTGSQQQQEQSTARVLGLPGGRVILVVVALILLAVCVQQIRGALAKDFRDGLELRNAPRPVKKVVDAAGVVGITARALVFLPIGIFLMVSAFEADPRRSYGTDGELLALSGHSWGIAVIAAVAAGLSVFVVYSALETRYRDVISAR